MNEMVKMIVVLTVLSAVSGGGLAAVKNGTAEAIVNQELKYEKAPAIKAIFAGAENDPVAQRFIVKDIVKDVEIERMIFVAKFEGKANKIALESSGKGFEGPIGVMVGIEVDTDKMVGAGVTTSSETPGIGARAKTDPKFMAQFAGQSIDQEFKVRGDGGQVDALSGATVTSKGVSIAMTEASAIYKRLKPQILEKIKEIN